MNNWTSLAFVYNPEIAFYLFFLFLLTGLMLCQMPRSEERLMAQDALDRQVSIIIYLTLPTRELQLVNKSCGTKISKTFCC